MPPHTFYKNIPPTHNIKHNSITTHKTYIKTNTSHLLHTSPYPLQHTTTEHITKNHNSIHTSKTAKHTHIPYNKNHNSIHTSKTAEQHTTTYIKNHHSIPTTHIPLPYTPDKAKSNSKATRKTKSTPY